MKPYSAEAYSELYQPSMIELFSKTVNGSKLSTIFAKIFITDT